MCSNRWNGIKKSSSPRFIPKWKNLKLLISDILKNTKTDEESKNNAVVLSDWPEILYQESQHPKNKAFICFYSINDNYFVSLDWMEPCENQVQAVLWILKKDTENKEVLEKLKFHVMVQVPPIKAMVHTGSYHTLIAYCGDMRLWLFRDHQRAFTFLGTVPCRFSISCLCYDSETKMLLCGTAGAVITWFLLPNGRELQLAQTVPLTGLELVQSFSLNGPQGSMLALCENAVRVFTHQGQGQLKEVKKFTLVTSGSSITCSFTCVSQGTFYAGTRAGEVHAWALERGNFLHSFQAHLSSVICVHSRPETHTLLTAGGEGVMREWNLASGSLLRQLTIDQDLQQLQFIDEITVFCQSTSAFSLHRLPYFYNLFHVCGSAPQQVQRVCCGHNWNRIFCATEDGLLRFLSPVTGDLLVITWPLLVMDKAVGWAFDSERQELFVATGGSEVLVFDATRSPCTAKYLVCPSGNSTDRVRCLAYGRSPLGKRLDGLMFCGHESGIVRILSHHNFARTEKIVHSGAVLTLCTLEKPQEKSLLCSYGKDNIVHLTEAVFQENKVILQPFSKMICVCPLKHVKLLPDSVGAITENCCWQLWHYQDFLTSSESKKSSPFTQTKCLHECAITSFDACYSLKLFVTGGIDGSVRIWDFHGRLVTELDSAFHFGPLCFANNRGDLLLTFNQSIYIVSCLKLLPPTQLIDLGNLNTEDEVQELPKPFLPSFFFLFEKVLVPKFCYLGQGFQEIQGLEILINKRAIAFDHTVPHVVEEDPQTSFVSQERSKWSFMEEKDIDICTPDRLPFVAPAQLQLAGWEGFNAYHIVRRFFGKGQAWPFTPDGYIPNSVIRACLWPQGTLVFLSCDLYSLYKGKDTDMTELLRFQALPPETPEDEKVSLSKRKAKFKEWQGSSFELETMAKQNWMGRKFSEGIVENLIEKILNLTIYCSVEEYKKYFSVLAQIFATYQIPSRLCTDTACQLLKDTIHSNPHIRELAWEMLERLGIMNRCFVIPLTMGLMDADKNVRTKVLHLLRRVTGIQTKTMLIRVLKKSETLQEMQMEIIGDSSLGQLMDIQDSDIQRLHTQVEQRLNENLTMSHKDRSFSFSLDLSIEDQLKSFDEETIIPLSETLKISKWREMKKRVQAKNKTLIKKDLRVAKKPRKAELRKIASVLVISEDVAEQREEVAEQREVKRSEQFDTQDIALEPKLPLSTFIPVKPKTDAKEKEVVLEAMESTESLVVTEDVEPTDQPRMEDETQVISKMKKQDRVKELWKRAIKKGYAIAIMLRKEKEDTKDISEAITKESMEELIQVSEQQKDKRKKPGKKVHGVAGIPGRIGKLDTSSWRNDISYLVTSRIASSNPDMLKDLSKELVDLARVMLAGQQPSWDLFQEICPLLEDSKSLSSKLDDRVVAETETAVIEDIKEEEKVIPRGKGDKPSKTQKVKKVSFLEDHLALEKRKFKAAVRKPAKQEGELVKEEREPTKKKLIQGKEKLTKDEKNLIHPEEKMAPEEEILAFPQKKLTTEEQMLVLEERRLTGKEREPLAKETKGTQEEGKPFLEWEETTQAQQESIQTRKERQLSQKKKELGKKEEPVSKEDKLSWEKEDLAGEELTWEKEELSGEEEELTWEEEELTPGIEKQVGEKKTHVQRKEKPVEEETWKLEKLTQEGLLADERKKVLEMESLAGQDNKLIQEEKKLFGKEAHKKKHIQEKHVEEQDEQERQIQKEKKEAKKTRQLALKREKLDLEGYEKLEEMEGLSQQDKVPWKKARESKKKERRTQKKEKIGPAALGKEDVGLEKEKPAEEKEEWLKEKEKPARKRKKQTMEEKRQVREEEELAEEVEKEAEKNKKRAKHRKKTKQFPEREKMMEEIDTQYQKEAQQVMKKEKQAKKEKKWARPDEDTAEKKAQWIQEAEKLTVQEERLPKKKRTWSQKKKERIQKEEEEDEQKKQWTHEKEKLLLDKSREMEKQFQEKDNEAKEKEKMILDERLIIKHSELAKKKRHDTKKERPVAKEITFLSKGRETITQEEKEIVKKEDSLFQEKRKSVYDIKTKVRETDKERKKLTKQERIQAMRKLDMENISFKEKEKENLKMKEKLLLKVLTGAIRNMSTVPLRETKTIEEERSPITRRSETDGHRWEYFKGQKERTEEEKEQFQKERKLDDDRMATREGTWTEKESLEEDKRLLEEAQEKIVCNDIQLQTILKEAEEQNLLDKSQLEELVRRIEENEPEKTQTKWLLENIRDILLEDLQEDFTEETEEGPVKGGREEKSPIEEGTEKKVKEEREMLIKKKKKKKVSLSEEELEDILAKKHEEKNFARKRRQEKSLARKKKRLSRKKKESPTEKEEYLSREDGEHPSEEEKEGPTEEGEDGKTLPKKEKRKHLIKQKEKGVSLSEEEPEEDLTKKHKKKSFVQERKRGTRLTGKEEKLRKKKKEEPVTKEKEHLMMKEEEHPSEEEEHFRIKEEEEEYPSEEEGKKLMEKKEDAKILPKKEKRKYLFTKKKRISRSEEELEEDLTKKHEKKSFVQERKRGMKLTGKEEKLREKKRAGTTEQEEYLSKEQEEPPSKEEDKSLSEEEGSPLEKGEDGKILPKKEKRNYLIKIKEKRGSPSEAELEEDLAKKYKRKSLAQKRKKEKRLAGKEKKLSRKEKAGPTEKEKHFSMEEEEFLSKGEEESFREKEEESPSEEEDESLSEEEEESLSEKEESLSEEEEESLSEKEEETLSEKEEESLSEEEEESLSEEEEESLSEEEESLSEEEEESLSEEEEESLSEEEESLSEEEEQSLSEEEEESLSEEEKESLSEEEEESLSEEEEESLSEEEEESLSEEEEESLSEEEEESLSEEEEESLSEEEESLTEEEEGSPSKEEQEREKMERKEKKARRQKHVDTLSKEKQMEHRLRDVMHREEGALKTEISKKRVDLPEPIIEGEGLGEKGEGTRIGKKLFKNESLFHGKRKSSLLDKSSFKIPLQVALEKKERIPLKALRDHMDLEKRQEDQLFEQYPLTYSLRRQKDVLLEKAKYLSLQTTETGLETQIPKAPHKPEFQLADMILKPRKAERTHKADRCKWFLRYHDLPEDKTEGQAQAPAPAPAPTPIPILASSPERSVYSEVSMSDEDWIPNTLLRLESGEQLSRDSFHRLSQLLRDFPAKEYLNWMHLFNLKTISKHFGKKLELSHSDKFQPYKDVLSSTHLKVIPPIRRKEKESMLEPLSVPEPVVLSVTKRTQTQPTPDWHFIAQPYRQKQAQLSMAVKEIKHPSPIRRYVPRAVYPLVDKKFLPLKSKKGFPSWKDRGEPLQFSKARRKALPTPGPVLPPIIKRIQVPKTINWHILGEPYRSARVQQLSNALKQMETQHFYPTTRDIFTGAHTSVDKQTLALMFQKDLKTFKSKCRPHKLPKLEKKPQPILHKKEELPLWETFVALYYVLRMLQQRYAQDTAAWMEQFNQLMDLYQLKSPRIRKLLQDLLLTQDEPQIQEITYKEALNTTDLVPGERLFYHLFCSSSRVPRNPPEFQDVIPLPGQNKVHTVQPVGIAQYGFLELAWKSLPQINPYCIERPPSVPTPTF